MMARISKTICDACGFTETDGEQSYSQISRITIAIGYPQRGTDICHTGRELCHDCRDAMVKDIQAAIDAKRQR